MAHLVMNRLPLFVAVLALMAMTSTATANEPLNDPTRPPIAPAGPVASIEKRPSVEGLVLQSVLVAADRRAAVISGRMVAIGGSVGGYRLVQVGENDVTLSGPEGIKTLKLFPAVQMRDVDDYPPVARGKDNSRLAKRP